MRRIIAAAVLAVALTVAAPSMAASGVVAPGASASATLADGSTLTITNTPLTTGGARAAPTFRAVTGASALCTTCQYDVTIRICAPVWCGFWSQTTRVTGVWFNGSIAWRGGSAYINPYWSISTWGYTVAINGTWWSGWNPASLYGGQYIGANTSILVCTGAAGGGCNSRWTQITMSATGNVGYYTG